MEFRNFKQFVSYFDDERICREYLIAQRWKYHIECLNCKSDKIYRYADGRKFKCSVCKLCFTATTGTIFFNSKIPLSSWFLAIYLFTSHRSSVSAHQISRHIGVSPQSALYMHHRIMEALVINLENLPASHGSFEVDEVYIGPSQSKMSYRRRKKIKQWFGGTHQTAILAFYKRHGDLFGMVIPTDANRQQVQTIVKRYVQPVSVLMTDKSGLYKDLDQYYVSHEVFNHSRREYARGFHHTNTVEGSFKLFKDSIRGSYKRLTKKYMNRYWSEFCFRYNNRHLTDAERFEKFFQLVGKYVSHKQLVQIDTDESVDS